MKNIKLLLPFFFLSTISAWAQNSFPPSGDAKLAGTNVLEFGQGATKQSDAGKIGYQRWSDALDIVGAGTTGSNRKIKFWGEGGSLFTGGVTINSNLEILQATSESPALKISNVQVVPQMLNGSWNGIAKLGDTGIIMLNGQSLVIAPHHGSVSGLRMTAEGAIGIGTSDPKGYKLAIAGKAVAEEVTVKLQASWPDYVFNSDYNLLSLEEIKTYIDKNKHLPEVPSAKEMEANGVNLGEMNMLLLKKIEELTLYVIDQKEEMEILKLENIQLTSRVNSIEKHN